MRQATVLFVFNPAGQILLAMKKRGFGEGKWNGAGGKVEDGESVIEAAIRELREETCISITPENIEARGVLHCFFPGWERDLYIFVTHGYTGEFEETEEMKPAWFSIDKIPYETMWEGDVYWLPKIIDGEKIEAEVHFDKEGNLIEYTEVYGG